MVVAWQTILAGGVVEANASCPDSVTGIDSLPVAGGVRRLGENARGVNRGG
jgi:hypothetical protein